MSFFSIIIPVYNAEAYIKRCIDSIRHQSFTDIEIIAINDGSRDDSLSILEAFAKIDSRIIVISENNSGQVVARNAGIQRASGKYIGFVDADDYIEKDLFQIIYDEIISDNPDIVMFDAIMHKLDGTTEIMQKDYEGGFYNKEKLRDKMYPNMLYAGEYYTFGCYPCLWNKVFRKDIIRKANKDVPIIVKNGEDACATYGALLLANSVSYLKGLVGYNYMINESSVTQTRNHSSVDSVIKLTDYIITNTIFDSEHVMKNQIMYYGCMMFSMIIADLKNTVEYSEQYSQLRNSQFGCELAKQYKKMKDLPAMEKWLIEDLFHPGILHDIKKVFIVFYNKLFKQFEVR